MRDNKLLYRIYASVKTLNKEKMGKYTKLLNKMNTKIMSGGAHDEDIAQIHSSIKEIDDNINAIDGTVDDFFTTMNKLRKYLDRYVANSEKFGELMKGLPLDSVVKLKEALDNLNTVLREIR